MANHGQSVAVSVTHKNSSKTTGGHGLTYGPSTEMSVGLRPSYHDTQRWMFCSHSSNDVFAIRQREFS